MGICTRSPLWHFEMQDSHAAIRSAVSVRNGNFAPSTASEGSSADYAEMDSGLFASKGHAILRA